MVDSKWNIIQQVSKTYQFKTTLNIRSIDAEFWLHSSFLFFQKSGLLSVALRKIIKALKSHMTCYNLNSNSFSTNLRNLSTAINKFQNCLKVGFPRDGTSQDKKKSCPIVPLSWDKSRSKNTGTKSSLAKIMSKKVKNCQLIFFPKIVIFLIFFSFCAMSTVSLRSCEHSKNNESFYAKIH